MTEQEWLECTDPQKMLEFLRNKASERKLRLFTVACCRRIWHLLTDERSREAVEEEEQLAEGHPTPQRPFRIELEAMEAVHSFFPTKTARFAAAISAWLPFLSSGFRRYTHDRARYAAIAAVCASRIYSHVFDDGSSFSPTEVKNMVVRDALAVAGSSAEAVPSEPPMQAALLRDIFGNPFRLVTINAAWLTWNDGTVQNIAQAVYAERAFDRMPILADALEESGCTNNDILNHCRQLGEHVRGCWVVDLVLGKE